VNIFDLGKSVNFSVSNAFGCINNPLAALTTLDIEIIKEAAKQ
jgi:hypothetical protein